MIKESIRYDGISAKQSSVRCKKEAKTVNYRLGLGVGYCFAKGYLEVQVQGMVSSGTFQAVGDRVENMIAGAGAADNRGMKIL